MNFRIDFSEMFHDAQVWIVAGRGEYEVADELRRRVEEFGATAQITSFAVQRLNRLNPRCSHFVLLLPPSHKSPDGRLPMVALQAAASAPPRSTLVFVRFGDGRLRPNGLAAGSRDDVEDFAKTLHQTRPDLKVRAVRLSTAFACNVAADLVLGQIAGAGHFACAALSVSAPDTAPRAKRCFTRAPACRSESHKPVIRRGATAIAEACAVCIAVARWGWKSLAGELENFMNWFVCPPQRKQTLETRG